MCGKFENFDINKGTSKKFATHLCRHLVSLHAKFQLPILNSYLKCLRTRRPSKIKKRSDVIKKGLSNFSPENFMKIDRTVFEIIAVKNRKKNQNTIM